MTHFAVLAPPYAGHLNPMLALAGDLLGRGHHVTFLGQADMEPLVARPGIGFAPLGAVSHPPGMLDEMTRRLASTTGLFGIGAVIRDVARTTEMLCREGSQCLASLGAHAILADQTEAAGGLLARRLGLPHISVANALLINREPLLPPPFIGWTYDSTEWGLKRNRGGYRVADWMMQPVFRVIRRFAATWGLGPLATLEDCLSPVLQISQTVEGFDFPRRQAPKALVHVGPLRHTETQVWPKPGSSPLIFCSLGTLQGARLPIFRKVAHACHDLGFSLVIAHGGKLNPRQIASLPGAPHVKAYVPQRAVITHAAAVITHGGLNTVLDALAAGVPQLVVPLAFEQSAIAARIVRCGAGISIPPNPLVVPRLKAALTALITESAYRDRSATLRDEIAGAGGLKRACELVEATIAHPAFAPT